MNNLLRVFLRLITLVLAISAVVLILLGGFWYVVQDARGNAPQLRYTVTGQTLERLVLGAYLRFRAADVSRPANPNDAREIVFVIDSGRTASQVGNSLESMGFVSDGGLFTRLVQYMGVEQDIQAGVYALRPNMTMEEIAGELQHGRLLAKTVLIREGWRAEEIAALLEQSGVISSTVFLAAVQQGRDDFGFLRGRPAGSVSSLEGFLFPDTYQFPEDSTLQRVLDMMLQNWDRRVPQELRDKAAERKMSLYEVVTLASIVEREAVKEEERATIAGVYVNRLRRGMYLQADATVQYAKGYVVDKDAGRWTWWSPMVVEDYTRVVSPYSTYLNAGLPPGPICNPGLDSIAAALEPEAHEYLYYYAKGDGSHVFARTFEEHQKNIQEYAGKQKK